MLNEYQNLVSTEKEMKLQVFINELTNELYNNEKIEIDSKKLLELLSYLTSNENISTQMKSAIEYQNRRIVDILHKKEVKYLKKYIKEIIKEKQELTTALLDSMPVRKVKDKIEENNKIMIDTQNKYPGTYAMLDEWRNAKAQNDILEDLTEDK